MLVLHWLVVDLYQRAEHVSQRVQRRISMLWGKHLELVDTCENCILYSLYWHSRRLCIYLRLPKKMGLIWALILQLGHFWSKGLRLMFILRIWKHLYFWFVLLFVCLWKANVASHYCPRGWWMYRRIDPQMPFASCISYRHSKGFAQSLENNRTFYLFCERPSSSSTIIIIIN